MKSTKEFWSKRQFTDASAMEQWLLNRQRAGESELIILDELRKLLPFPPRLTKAKGHYGGKYGAR